MASRKRFFCLRGFMKSGTNWLGGLLDRHPDVSCRGEYHWHLMLQPLLERQSLMCSTHHKETWQQTLRIFREAVQRSMAAQSDPRAKVLGDRTPHTIDPLVLKAPHIVIVRDPRDVLVSRAFHIFNQPQITQLFKRHPDLQASLERFQANKWHFQENPDQLLSNSEMVRLTGQWWSQQQVSDRRLSQSGRVPVRFVKYEELHERTSEISAELFEFLSVDPALAPPIQGNLAPGFSTENPDKFLRKGAVGDWQNYFTDQTKNWYKEVVGEELIRWGYETNDRW